MTKALFIKHPACPLVGLRDLHVPLKGLSTSRSLFHHCSERRHLVLLVCWLVLTSNGSLHSDFLLDLSSQGCSTLQLSHLLVDIISVVSRHLHTFVEVIKSWVTHFQCFCWNGWDTSKISSITLVLQYCLLSKLDPVLFFKLLNECFEELLLRLEFLDFCLNFKCDILLDLSFVHSVASHLWVQFPVPYWPEKKTSQIKFLAEVHASFFITLFFWVFFPESE